MADALTRLGISVAADGDYNWGDITGGVNSVNTALQTISSRGMWTGVDNPGTYSISGLLAFTGSGGVSGNLAVSGGGTFGGDILISNTSTTGFKIQDSLSNNVLTVDTDTFSGRVVIAPGVSFENNVSTSQDPANDLGVTMQWISNTSLRVKMKGDDGVVRSVDLTLS